MSGHEVDRFLESEHGVPEVAQPKVDAANVVPAPAKLLSAFIVFEDVREHMIIDHPFLVVLNVRKARESQGFCHLTDVLVEHVHLERARLIGQDQLELRLLVVLAGLLVDDDCPDTLVEKVDWLGERVGHPREKESYDNCQKYQYNDVDSDKTVHLIDNETSQFILGFQSQLPVRDGHHEKRFLFLAWEAIHRL